MAPRVPDPGPARSPTTAQVREGQHAQRPGEPVAENEPAASPLGTDDEAAGRAPNKRRLQSAMKSLPDSGAHDRHFLGTSWMPVVALLVFAAFLALLIAALLIS